MAVFQTYIGATIPSGPCAFPFEETVRHATSRFHFLIKTRQTASIRRLIDDYGATSYE